MRLARLSDFDGDGIDDLVWVVPSKIPFGERRLTPPRIVTAASRGIRRVASVANYEFLGVVHSTNPGRESVAAWACDTHSICMLSVPDLIPERSISDAVLGGSIAPRIVVDCANPFDVSSSAFAISWVDPAAKAFGRAPHSIEFRDASSWRRVFELASPRTTDAFGLALDSSNDFDCDGTADLCVAWRGGLGIYSTRAMLWLWTRDEPDCGSDLRVPLAVVGDVDRDGTCEIAIGEPDWRRVGESRCGRVVVFSGRTGDVVQIIRGTDDDKLFGFAIAATGDFDRDGIDELAIASPFTPDVEPEDPFAENCIWLVDLAGSRRRCFGFSRVYAGGYDVFGVSLQGCASLDPNGHAGLFIGGQFDWSFDGPTTHVATVSISGGYQMDFEDFVNSPR